MDKIDKAIARLVEQQVRLNKQEKMCLLVLNWAARFGGAEVPTKMFTHEDISTIWTSYMPDEEMLDCFYARLPGFDVRPMIIKRLKMFGLVEPVRNPDSYISMHARVVSTFRITHAGRRLADKFRYEWFTRDFTGSYEIDWGKTDTKSDTSAMLGWLLLKLLKFHPRGKDYVVRVVYDQDVDQFPSDWLSIETAIQYIHDDDLRSKINLIEIKKA
jgi:hypothetical protein